MRQLAPPPKFRPGPDNPFQPWMLREQFVKHLASQMELTPEQTRKITAIVQDSQQRTEILTGLIEPEMREELRNVRQAIREVLTPAQRERYEEILRKRFRKEKDGSKGHPRDHGVERGPAPDSKWEPDERPRRPDR